MNPGLLRQLFTAMNGLQVAVGRSLGLGSREIAALGLVAYSDSGTETSELRRHLGLSAAATTELVDRLVAMGHLARSRSVSDRRVVLLSLTLDTKRVINGRLAPLLALLDGIDSEISEEHRRVVQTYLTRAAEVYVAAGAKLTSETRSQGHSVQEVAS